MHYYELLKNPNHHTGNTLLITHHPPFDARPIPEEDKCLGSPSSSKMVPPGDLVSSKMVPISGSDHGTRSVQSCVTAMWTGKTRGWPRSTIIFQDLIPGTRESRSHLVGCGSFPPAARNRTSLSSASWIWTWHCFCAASMITSAAVAPFKYKCD